MKTKIAGLGLLSLALVGLAQAQEGWNWPSDPQAEAKAREYNAAYGDYLSSEDYVAATKPLSWLLNNAPDLNESIYIKGVRVYAGAADEAADEAQKRIYQDSVILLYDKRNEIYDNEDKWIENKAYYAYNFYKGDKDKVAEAAGMFDRAIEIHNTLNPTLVGAHFDLIYRNYAYNSAYSPEEILEKYEKLSSILEEAESNGTDVTASKNVLEQLLIAMEIIDCDFIDNNMGAKLTADPDNMKLAQQIFQYSVQYKCTSSAAFNNALEVIDNNDPTFSTSQVRGMRYLQNGEHEKAIELFEKALTLADTDEKKGEVQFDIAKAYSSLGRKGQARSSALKAAEFDRSKEKEVYTLIGGLYMTSSGDCRGGQSRVKDYSIYIAAYDAYARAGDSSGMANAKARFPSKEELFTEGFQVGESISTGCWIGQDVTLATRD